MLYRYSLKARPSVYLLYRRCTERFPLFLYPEPPAIVAGIYVGFADKQKNINKMNKIDSRDRRPRLSENNGISFVIGERINLKICGRDCLVPP